MTEHNIVTTEQLRQLYRMPSKLVESKKTGHLDEITASVVRSSPFFLVSSSDADGNCDVSPRGGPPGQLVVLDDKTIVFPDLNGNNLIDSLTNFIENPKIGLLVLTPGRDETLRIDGTARLTTDPELLGLWEGSLRQPKVAIVVTVENAFMHCAKAFRRAEFWNPESWQRFDDVADPMEMLLVHTGMDADVPTVRAMIEESYVEGLAEDQP